MKITQLIPNVEVRVRFSLRDHRLVPEVSGCYVLTTFHGDVLYVGLATDLHSRFAQHRDDAGKCGETPFGVAFWFYFLLADSNETRRVERTWQNLHLECHGELPCFNKVYSPVD